MRFPCGPQVLLVRGVLEESSQARQVWGWSADTQARKMPRAAHRPHPSLAGLSKASGQGRRKSTLVPTPLGLRFSYDGDSNTLFRASVQRANVTTFPRRNCWPDTPEWLFETAVVVKSLSHVQLCDPMDCSTPGFLVYHQLPELVQTHIRRVSDAIQPSHPLSPPSPDLDLSQHQGLFQCVGSSHQFSSVAQLWPTLCDPMDCSTPSFSVHHQLPELTQTHIHQVSNAIQPFHPLSPPSPPAFNLSQHQGLFQWVSSSHQVAKVLEYQL